MTFTRDLWTFVKMIVRTSLLFDLTSLGLMAIVIAFGLTYISYKESRRANVTLETQVQSTMKALEANSKDTLLLVEKLQAETTARIERIRETEKQLAVLQDQRKLLDLTPEQRRALESLVQRPTSFWSLFKTWEFWISGVLVNVIIGGFFYWLGIRRGKQRARTS